ncbi:agmatinase [Wenyingzhuangia sp. 1_MG-2023]|nr:agmatinase [Wenyingzhuangia sp. 1_MG-2023]
MKTNYAGIPNEYAKKETANVVIIPVPYNGTSTLKTNADQGPEAFLEASNHMELYDIETDSEVYKQGIYLTDPVVENETPEAMLNAVYKNVKTYLTTKKFVTVMGGEHSTSIGTIKAFNEHFENLTVLHIDAHANLKKQVNGQKIHNACAMYHASQATNLVQIGIRSMEHIEKTVMDTEKVFFAHELATNDYWMETAIEAMTDNVFISFDLDSLDPSIMPSVSDPEQGGMFWYETLDFLYKVFTEKNVVGFDMVELCPNPNNKTPNALAARLFYKMLTYKFELNNDDEGLSIDENDFNSKENKLGKFHDDLE